MTMRFAMVVVKSDAEWEQVRRTPQEFDALVRWWMELRASGHITVGAELAPPATAVTVSWIGQRPIVTDGPYMEAKETVGGFGILNVDSAAEAQRIVSSWPIKAATRIELRPIVEQE